MAQVSQPPISNFFRMCLRSRTRTPVFAWKTVGSAAPAHPLLPLSHLHDLRFSLGNAVSCVRKTAKTHIFSKGYRSCTRCRRCTGCSGYIRCSQGSAFHRTYRPRRPRRWCTSDRHCKCQWDILLFRLDCRVACRRRRGIRAAHARWDCSHAIPSWRTAARTVPRFTSRPP